MIKLEIKENLEITNKAFFILKILNELHNKKMYGSMEYDWMRSDYNGYPFSNNESDFKSTRTFFYELINKKLVKGISVPVDSYFCWEITERGISVLDSIKDIDLSEFMPLIPEKFIKEHNLINFVNNLKNNKNGN
jgi:hypothetical protein